MVIINNLITKFRIFIDKYKKQFIITAIIFTIIAFISTIVYSYCSGVVKTVAFIICLVFISVAAIIFCVLYYIGNKKERKKDRTKYKDKAKNNSDIGQNQRKGINKFLLTLIFIMSISAVLCFSGIFMIVLSNISAVRIAGIVIASVFGLIMMLIMVFIFMFYT